MQFVGEIQIVINTLIFLSNWLFSNLSAATLQFVVMNTSPKHGGGEKGWTTDLDSQAGDIVSV